MKIAFDAKRYFHNKTGLGHYSRTLVNSLITYFPHHQYYLCNPKHSNDFACPETNYTFEITPSGAFDQTFSALWRRKHVLADLAAEGIDIFHGLSHELPSGIRKSGMRSVVTMHDLIFERYPHQYNWLDVKIYRSKFKQACANADAIIAISNQTKADLIDIYQVDESKITVCYQSCNPAFSEAISAEHLACIRKRYNLPAEYLLYVGSIIERKNLLNLCKALYALKGIELPPLVVIGEGGSYKHEVESYLQEHQMQRSVIFLSDDPVAQAITGYKTGADFPAIYRMATAMIYPSIFEGFGIPVLEALNSKIPVITSNISCLPEAGGPGAFLVDPFDPDAIASAIDTVLTDSNRVAESVALGSLYASQFDAKTCCEKVMEVYQSIL